VQIDGLFRAVTSVKTNTPFYYSFYLML